ncbi:MAG TPA: FliM/FliN family flagellar motor switch protein [Ramlibacter sp.]|jgi:hypothetical protein
MAASTERTSKRWSDATAARPLLCWRDTQVQALAHALEQALAAWCADWGLHPMGALACQPACGPASGEQWRSLYNGTADAGWLHVPAETPAILRELLFPHADASGRVAMRVVSECEQDGLQRLIAVLDLSVSGVANAGPSAPVLQHWSGTLEARLPPPLGWRIVLRSAALGAWFRGHGATPANRDPVAMAPLARVMDAVAALPVKLDVRLAGCELDVATLQRLQPGDVLRMRHGIDAPASVCDSNGTPLFSAYLGRRDGRRAVGLAGPGASRDQAVREGVQP